MEEKLNTCMWHVQSFLVIKNKQHIAQLIGNCPDNFLEGSETEVLFGGAKVEC